RRTRGTTAELRSEHDAAGRARSRTAIDHAAEPSRLPAAVSVDAFVAVALRRLRTRGWDACAAAHHAGAGRVLALRATAATRGEARREDALADAATRAGGRRIRRVARDRERQRVVVADPRIRQVALLARLIDDPVAAESGGTARRGRAELRGEAPRLVANG